MNGMIAIDLKLLKAAALFVSTEETRFYLNGVCLQPVPGGLVYVATDGQKLFAARQELAEGSNTIAAEIIVPRDVIARIKLDRRGSNVAGLFITDTIHTPTGCRLDFEDGTSVGFKAIDGAFPAWRRVVPAATDGVTAQFDARHLEVCRKAGEVLRLGLPEVAHNGHGPALVGWASDDCFAVVMPVRGGPAPTLPAWAMAETAKLAAA